MHFHYIQILIFPKIEQKTGILEGYIDVGDKFEIVVTDFAVFVTKIFHVIYPISTKIRTPKNWDFWIFFRFSGHGISKNWDSEIIFEH